MSAATIELMDNLRPRTKAPRVVIASLAILLVLHDHSVEPDALPLAGAVAASTSSRPARPLPPDYVEGFGNGQVLAFHYQLSYVCETTPLSDVDGPYGGGDGLEESNDPTEFQLPPCFFGDTGTGSIPPIGPDGRPLDEQRKLYAIVPAFSVPDLYLSNGPAGSVQTQCARPGLPFTEVHDAPGTCLMHPSLLHTPMATDPAANLPNPLPLPQHSHVVEGTSAPPSWWNAVGVNVTDASIWPDNDGHCPAGPPHCLTSLAAIRAAQRAGKATSDNPSNVFFYFSVEREASPDTVVEFRPATPRLVMLPVTQGAFPGSSTLEKLWQCVLSPLGLI